MSSSLPAAEGDSGTEMPGLRLPFSGSLTSTSFTRCRNPGPWRNITVWNEMLCGELQDYDVEWDEEGLEVRLRFGQNG